MPAGQMAKLRPADWGAVLPGKHRISHQPPRRRCLEPLDNRLFDVPGGPVHRNAVQGSALALADRTLDTPPRACPPHSEVEPAGRASVRGCPCPSSLLQGVRGHLRLCGPHAVGGGVPARLRVLKPRVLVERLDRLPPWVGQRRI